MSQTVGAGTPRLQFKQVSKRFGGTLAVSELSFDIAAGEIVALLGENGAGKSTLIKLLARIYPRDSGDILFDGQPIETLSSAPRGKQPIAFIHQDLGLIEWMTVAENIAFGTGFPRRSGLIDWKEVDRRATEVLARVGCNIPPQRRVFSLSRAEKSLLAIGRALAVDAQILVLDEPTASLPAADVQHLFTVLRQLRGQGVGMIYVSHRLDEVIELSDRVVVMRDGKLVAVRDTAQVSEHDLVHMIVGKEPSALRGAAAGARGATILELDALVAGNAGPVSLRVSKGELVGLIGLRGGGQESVSRALFGMCEIAAGKVSLLGRQPDLSTPLAAIRSGVALVAAERVEENLARSMSVQENLFFNPLLWHKNPFAWMRRDRERDRAKELIRAFDVRPAAPHAYIENLSGGNQQKVVLARWLDIGKPLLILEEPTAGVDVGAKGAIYRTVREVAAKGTGVLVVSTDFEEVANLCTRALVFCNGRIVAELEGDALSVPNLLQWAAGSAHLAPAAVTA
ncbi:sugar ABC transporter ATP-binding protein [Janthinobacterium sp. PC23-8]|uniref:sugar ABC transporter ATP-binding protein n=1 Tax=Janthinobacterium sp. PC23-8 TaxID=2012679 RepID=UPI000B97BDE3|nr:sugar ABC transporter ATP-binding protein [Janthinobacterium sp. PC23-8]OYO32089.1 sugar ABC transporter ATP-binding protein [Janthinobacterium sp. PC23-8]